MLLIESLKLLENNVILEFPKTLLDLLDNTITVRWYIFILFLLPIASLLFILEAINVLRE